MNMSTTEQKHTYVAIMAGGVGSRFWPASREALPKQFLDILGLGRSLLQLTFDRFTQLVPEENILIVTNGRYADLVKEQLPALSDRQILGEPSRNNTAPCIAYAAFKLAQRDPEARMVVAPSDHLILKEEVFLNDVRTALEFADRHEALLTLGIRPSRPDTGYGYIQYEKGSEAVKKVRQFTEKPPLADAERYLASGDYLWNAGIFIWKVSDVLNAFSRYAPEIHRILGADKEAYNTEREDEFIRKAYPTTPSISVDYALMEQADNVFTLPVDFGWSDLGTWASLHENAEKDNHRNKVFADQCLVQETTNTLIRVPREKLVVVRGLDNYIVVDEKDVLLIWPKSEEQAIKAARKEIEEKLGDQYL